MSKEEAQALIQRVNDLEQAFRSLSDYSTRTVEQDNAIAGRGFARTKGRTGTWPHTTYGGVGSYDVPSQPTGTLFIEIYGKLYEIPYISQ